MKRRRLSKLPVAAAGCLCATEDCASFKHTSREHRFDAEEASPVDLVILMGDTHGPLLVSGEHAHHVGAEERSAQVEQDHALHALGHAEKAPLLLAPLPRRDLPSSPSQLVQSLGRMRVLRRGTIRCVFAGSSSVTYTGCRQTAFISCFHEWSDLICMKAVQFCSLLAACSCLWTNT